MSKIISNTELIARRNLFSVGTRVELVHINDPHCKIRIGERGYVSNVDSIGTVFVNWDNGLFIGCCYGIDEIQKLNTTAIIKEQVLAIEKNNHTNMMDYKDVFKISKKLGFTELCDLISTDVNRYLKLISTGEFEDMDCEFK